MRSALIARGTFLLPLFVLAIIGLPDPLHAQARDSFVQGLVIADYYDAPVSLGTFGPSIEWGRTVATKQAKQGGTYEIILHVRGQWLNGTTFLSVMAGPHITITRRVHLELPIGATVLGRDGDAGVGGTIGLRVPVRITPRLAIVPDASGHLAAISGHDGGLGLWTHVGLGVRWTL